MSGQRGTMTDRGFEPDPPWETCIVCRDTKGATGGTGHEKLGVQICDECVRDGSATAHSKLLRARARFLSSIVKLAHK